MLYMFFSKSVEHFKQFDERLMNICVFLAPQSKPSKSSLALAISTWQVNVGFIVPKRERLRTSSQATGSPAMHSAIEMTVRVG